MSQKLYPLKLYLKYKPVLITTSISLLLNLCAWFWLLLQIRPSDEQVFLHYNILFGVDLIGNWWKVYYVPIAGLLIILVNLVIGWLLFQKDKFVAQLLVFIALYCQIVVVTVSLLLVFLNV